MTSIVALQVVFWSSLALAAYIYVGYPLIVWLRSRIKKQTTLAPNPSHAVSIVIVAHNEATTLPAKIDSLLASNQSERICEILIGLDGSTDNTAEVLAASSDVRVKVVGFPTRRGKPSVLNDLVPQCQSEIVLLADARQIFDADCVRQLLAHFADPTVGVVSGELVLRSDPTQTVAAAGIGFYWRYEKFIRRCESQGHGVPGATGACYAIRKSLFHAIPPATILDDVAIPMQAVVSGYRCLFEPAALVFDTPSKSTRQESVRKRRTIAGAAQLVRLFPQWLIPWRNPLWFEYVSHKLLRLASPLVMLMAIMTNLCLLEIPVYRVLLVAQIGFYAAALVGLCYQIAGRGSRLFGPPLMFVTLNLTTAVALWDALLSKYRVTWQKTT